MIKRDKVVCKFGGTSMATKKSISNIIQIIKSDPARKFVVVSAPGKRYSDDIKVTDMLYECFALKQKEGNCKAPFKLIKQRYIDLISDLELDYDLSDEFDDIEDKINKSETPDYAASRGEYLAAKIMAKLLGFDFCESADIIKFDEKGVYLSELSDDLINDKLKESAGAVIPGFYGAKPDGSIKTFTRGGSDITGSIIASGVAADIYENWTDVNGFMTADPRIVDNPIGINILTYDELRELSYMGANVLHPNCTFPLRKRSIPINIKNTFNTEHKGTMIVANSDNLEHRTVTGIAGRKGYTTFFIKKNLMNNEIGFGRRVLSVIEELGISFEHMPTGIDTMSLVIADEELQNGKTQKVVENIKKALQPDYLEVTGGLALIAIVGNGMIRHIGTAARICKSLSMNNINIRMIDQGSSEINVIIGVDESDYKESIKSIYSEFFH